MKERPILFSAPMVRATLSDDKVQTRRVVKLPRHILHDDVSLTRLQPGYADGVRPVWEYDGDPNAFSSPCPYGVPGDRLYVKEATYLWCERVPDGTTKTGRPKWRYVPMEGAPVHYVADGHGKPTTPIVHPKTGNEWGWRYKTARFMPRWASRLTLEITDVRVERVQEISNADAKAEGVVFDGREYRESFCDLWDSINADRGYGVAANPLVWALTFKRVEVT